MRTQVSPSTSDDYDEGGPEEPPSMRRSHPRLATTPTEPDQPEEPEAKREPPRVPRARAAAAPLRVLARRPALAPAVVGRPLDAAIVSLPIASAAATHVALHPEHYVFVGARTQLRKAPFEHPEDARAHTLLDVRPGFPLFRYLMDAAPPGRVSRPSSRVDDRVSGDPPEGASRASIGCRRRCVAKPGLDGELAYERISRAW